MTARTNDLRLCWSGRPDLRNLPRDNPGAEQRFETTVITDEGGRATVERAGGTPSHRSRRRELAG